MTFDSIAADFSQHWLVYLSMPIVAAVIGYVTKVVAIYMMFEPIEFKGWAKWKLGWQGVVPSRAEQMARISCRTMTGRLIQPRDIFARIDPDRVAQEVEGPMLATVEGIIHEVMTQHQPGLWEAMPQALRARLIARIQRESPAIIRQIFQQMKDNIDNVFDLEEMVVSNLLKDKRLLNQIFTEVGHAEFNFIRYSGIVFGGIIGVVQAAVWIGTKSPIVLPIFGAFTGWFTDWLALQMIFRPQQPTKYFFGLFEWQGLFLKRKQQVSAEYGALVAERILTPSAIMESVLTGPLSDRLVALVQKEVQAALDQQAGLLKPFVVLAVGGAKYQAMKKSVSEQIMARLPETFKHIEAYAAEAMDIRNTIVTKMQELTAQEFEELLRPAFKQEEWKLIAVGAVLGFLIGEFQVLVMLH